MSILKVIEPVGERSDWYSETNVADWTDDNVQKISNLILLKLLLQKQMLHLQKRRT